MIAIGADHGGFSLKEKIIDYYKSNDEIQIKDYGAFDEIRGLEEPNVAIEVAESVANGVCEMGILICRSGIGMSMTANKVRGIRCGLVFNIETAVSSKEHNNANIIALPADFIDLDQAISFIESWKNAKFLGGIYEERLDIVSAYESK